MKTLAMIKMEKNFVAHIDKQYPRKPYEIFDLKKLMFRLFQEVGELREAIVYDKDFEKAKLECADVSNIIDYIFEKLMEA